MLNNGRFGSVSIDFGEMSMDFDARPVTWYAAGEVLHEKLLTQFIR